MKSLDPTEKTTDPKEKTTRYVRRLIWLYFWLLVFEGALRKWVVPQYSNALLIVRDPVLLAIYALAIKARLFPRHTWILSLAVMGVLSLGTTLVQLWPYLQPYKIALVGGYGFRSNFLHLPLIFVIAAAMRFEDVRRIGWWTLLLMPPMALLLVGQFNAAPDAFLNRTAGGEGEMMMAALGKVRTAGTFSFVIGVASFFALATAYLIYGALKTGAYKTPLLIAAGSALVIGIAVSGSRTVVAACAVVVGSLAVVLFLQPRAVNRFGQALIATLVMGLIVTKTPIFREGLNVLTTRFAEVAEQTEQSIARGMVVRVFETFGEGFFVYSKAPLLGYGLGIGTNAGARFLTGRSMFLLSEGEWSRIFLEMGPVLGPAYLFWRCACVFYVGLLALRALKIGNILPGLLFSACFLSMISGQFGQPTILGFTVFVMGLALAATRGDQSAAPVVSQPKSHGRSFRGRSVYSEALHGSRAANGQTNGAVDR